jgi:hypothetical protein
MKITSGIALTLLGVLLGAITTSSLGVRQAEAQPPRPGQIEVPSRFQVSAYAAHTVGGIGHGCYIIDSATGELWHARSGGQLEKVSAKIR